MGTVIPRKISERLQDLLSYYKDGVKARSLLLDYEDEYESRLDYRSLGFNTLEDFLQSSSNILTYERLDDRNRTLIVYEKGRKRGPKSKVPHKHQENLRRLMRIYPDGIAASNLSRLYKNEFGMELDYHDCGFDSLKSFLQEFSNCVQLTQEGSTLVVNPVINSAKKSSGGSSSSKIPSQLKRNLAQMMKRYKHGLEASHLARAYSMMYNDSLEFYHYGYSSLKQFLEDCSDAIDFTHEKSKVTVYPKENVGRDDKHKSRDQRREDSARQGSSRGVPRSRDVQSGSDVPREEGGSRDDRPRNRKSRSERSKGERPRTDSQKEKNLKEKDDNVKSGRSRNDKSREKPMKKQRLRERERALKDSRSRSSADEATTHMPRFARTKIWTSHFQKDSTFGISRTNPALMYEPVWFQKQHYDETFDRCYNDIVMECDTITTGGRSRRNTDREEVTVVDNYSQGMMQENVWFNRSSYEEKFHEYEATLYPRINASMSKSPLPSPKECLKLSGEDSAYNSSQDTRTDSTSSTDISILNNSDLDSSGNDNRITIPASAVSPSDSNDWIVL